MQDILEGKPREVKIGEHGVVYLVDVMPRLVEPKETLDHAVLQMARVSYGADLEKKTEKENRNLIRFLMRHRHVTPFEGVNVKFFMALPIFVARQLIRHRTASVNEYSMRYKEPKERAFVPDLENVRKQSKTNKQGSDGQVDDKCADMFIRHTEETFEGAFFEYTEQVKSGISREMARINLPLSTFTEWYWECDLNNILNFLSLRMDKHAQKEIRDYANAMHSLLEPLAPWTFEAFEDFHPLRSAMILSRLDKEILHFAIHGSGHALAIASANGWLERREDGALKEIRERIECETKLEYFGVRIPWKD